VKGQLLICLLLYIVAVGESNENQLMTSDITERTSTLALVWYSAVSAACFVGQ
jgi:hypothetical protein